MKVKVIRKFGETGPFAAAVQYITVPFVPLLAKIFRDPNRITLMNLVLVPIMLVALMTGKLVLAAIFSLLFMYIDNCDGYVARYLNKTSKLGALLDALTDYLFWLSIIVGLYLYQPSVIYVVLLGIGGVDLYLRYLTGIEVEHSEDLYANAGTSFVKKIYKSFACFGNTMTLLAVILLISPKYLFVFWIFELTRVSIATLLRVGRFIKFLKKCDAK
ncbi:MAG: CDP-alcohol phosphatidyltransferase family protein [Gammaproteobacteria bacterium]